MTRGRSGNWNRSSPWFGALGGLLVSLSYHVLGFEPGEHRAWSVWDLLAPYLDVPGLLSTHPVASTAVLGWIGRALEPRA